MKLLKTKENDECENPHEVRVMALNTLASRGFPHSSLFQLRKSYPFILGKFYFVSPLVKMREENAVRRTLVFIKFVFSEIVTLFAESVVPVAR